nr:MAG TPA: hypothetical protein [Caudoviricetes sp.]
MYIYNFFYCIYKRCKIFYCYNFFIITNKNCP